MVERQRAEGYEHIGRDIDRGRLTIFRTRFNPVDLYVALHRRTRIVASRRELDDFVAAEATAASAIGDEAAEMFDFDIAL